jgi:hypothetical protein
MPFCHNNPMKRTAILIVILIFVQSVFTQNERPKPGFNFAPYGITIEPEKRLIVVMAALDAGGLETELTSKGVIFRNELREDLKNSLKPETREKLKIFIAQYKRRHPNVLSSELASPFISLAYALGPVPELTDPKKVDDLPGDLLEVFDFAPLVREFYRNSGIELKMLQYIKSHQAVADLLIPSARQMTLELCDYLHTRPQLSYIERVVTKTNGKSKGKTLSKSESRERERRFFIIPDLLTPVKTVNFRNIGDDYFAIVPPNTNLLSSEVRRGYLQFIADSLVTQNVKDIAPHKDAIKILLEDLRVRAYEKEKAKNPKISLDDIYFSPDIFLAVSRSFVAAADVRESEFRKIQIATFRARDEIDLAKGEEAKLKVSSKLTEFKKNVADESALQLSESYEKGSPLAFYFADQLKGLEESGFDVASSFKDMMQALDPSKEQNRLGQFAEARMRALKSRDKRRDDLRKEFLLISEVSRKDNEFFDKIAEVNDMVAIKSYTQADNRLGQLLDEFPDDSRLYYMRGKVASAAAESIFDPELLEAQLMKAATYYRNAILSKKPKTQTESGTNDRLISQSHVALGRILEFNDEFDLALKEFEAAIKLGGNHDAYAEAVAGRNRLTKKN